MTKIAIYDIKKTIFDIARSENSTYDGNIDSALAENLMARWKGEISR